MPAVVSTRRLFSRLLSTLDIDTVCDVGSMDGHEAREFRRRLPGAAILAFEPHPQNFARMSADPRLREQGIRVFPFAASDRDAEAPFFLVQANAAAPADVLNRGRSSLLRRDDDSRLDSVVPVRTVRLDRLLAQEQPAAAALALWIDVEGMAFEAISGASGLLGRARLLHVEVEAVPCIGPAQKLFRDVLNQLEQAGFELLATDAPTDSVQFNALFVRGELLRARAPQIRAWLVLAWLRRRAGRLARKLRPRG